nr:MAG TPA: hypothetical protein [Caudoviricetes sp.]DAF03443.1 MAG TPA: hypothetical protein [Bacteriophage sp.]
MNLIFLCDRREILYLSLYDEVNTKQRSHKSFWRLSK